jgi:hypothetical protein
MRILSNHPFYLAAAFFISALLIFISYKALQSHAASLIEDLNGDGTVNVFDLSVMLSAWGTSGTSDINQDGSVNIFDLSVLLSHWGQSAFTPLPAKVSGVYWPNWTGTPSLRNIPTTDNLIYAAFAYGDGSNSGAIVWHSDDGSGVSLAQFKSDVQYAQAHGQQVILSIGGANDLGIHLTNAAQVTQMVNCINQLVTDYGFDGIDWDLEHDANITAASLVSASNQLKQKWGQSFIISMAPAPSDTLYKQAAQQLRCQLGSVFHAVLRLCRHRSAAYFRNPFPRQRDGQYV